MFDDKLLSLNTSWVQLQTDLQEMASVLFCLAPSANARALIAHAHITGIKLTSVGSATEAVERLETAPYDILVVSDDLHDLAANDLIRYVRGQPVALTVIVLARQPNPRRVLDAISLGVSDYLLEPEQQPEEVAERILRRLRQVAREKLQQRMIQDLRELVQEKAGGGVRFHEIVTELEDALEAERRRLGPMNRVLIASPDGRTRRTLRSTLAGAGLTPVAVPGGHTALELLAAEGTDLMVLSSELPDAALDQMLARINSVHEGLPVVLLADVQDLDTALHALHAGVADCLRQPIASPVHAAHRIAKLLRERRRDFLADHLVKQLFRLTHRASSSDGLPVITDETRDMYDKVADAPFTVDFMRLDPSEFEPAEGARDVEASGDLPDTVILEYIDELLYSDERFLGGEGAGQRLSPRVETSLFVRYGPTGTEHVSLGYAHDLSLGGIFVLSEDPPPKDSDLQLELHVPHERGVERVKVQGRVVWVTDPDMEKPHGDGFGVQFTVVDRIASKAILQAVTE